MKRICVLIAAICLMAPVTFAQDSGGDTSGSASEPSAPSGSPEAASDGDTADPSADSETPAADESSSESESGEEAEGEAPAGAADDGAYGVRIRELEGQLDELKEDVFRSKSRLYLLREQIVQDSVGNARATITHVNEFSRTFELLEVRYSLDGTPIYSANKEDDDLNKVEELELYSGVVLPGVHNLAVQMVVRGNPRGPFTYPRGYEFEITTSHAFSVEGGQTIDLDVVTYSGGNAHEDFARRPDVRFDQTTSSAGGETVESEGSESSDEEADTQDSVPPAESSGSGSPQQDMPTSPASETE